jgi:hypothetical protein
MKGSTNLEWKVLDGTSLPLQVQRAPFPTKILK